MLKMRTAKKMDFKKGDFIFNGLFPGIIIQNVNTSTPLCEIWGIEHEMGSVYATDLRKLSFDEFQVMVRAQSHELEIKSDSEVGRKAIKDAEIKATKVGV